MNTNIYRRGLAAGHNMVTAAPVSPLCSPVSESLKSVLVSTPQSRPPMPATAALLALMHPELQLQQRCLAPLAGPSPVARP